MDGWSSDSGYFDRVLIFEACQSQCMCYLVPLFDKEIIILSENTKIKWYNLVDLLLYIYIYICMYAAETWNLKGKEERIVAMCEGEMLRRICGPKSE